MNKYTIDDAEADLRVALEAGDHDEIQRLSAEVDRLDPLMHQALQQVTTLAAALWYAEAGLGVFPIQPGLKIPYAKTQGFKDASTDPDIIRAWCERWPDANLAFATGGLIDVVDIDGPTGQKSRSDNWDLFESLDVLAKVSTPRPGGMHLYVRPAGRGNKAGLLPGVDYRGRSGYVLCPPSWTADGTYRFIQPLDPAVLGAAA